MKNILILLLLIYSKLGFSLSIISDLDDTIKVTNVLDLDEAARNALFSKKAFSHFPKLIRKMMEPSDDLYIVSASPNFLKKPVELFLEHQQLDFYKLQLRNIFSERDSFEYKLEKITEIFNSRPSEKFILIGDNTQNDPAVYKIIKKRFLDRVAAIYIRLITKTKIPDIMTGFYSPFEVAGTEYLSGRLRVMNVLGFGKDILISPNLEDLIPDFAYCPKEHSDFKRLNSSTLRVTYAQVRAKIIKYCRNRRSDV